MAALLGALVLLVSAAVTVLASFTSGGGDILYSRVLACVMFGLATYILAQPVYPLVARSAATDVSGEDESGESAWPETTELLRLAGAVALTAAYVYAWEPIGFVAATCLFLPLMSLLLGERSLPALVLTAPILAGLVWVLMRHLLHVPLPAGTFW